MPQPTRPPSVNKDSRRLGAFDQVIGRLDQALKAIAGPHPLQRKYPALDVPETVVDDEQRREIAGLMRINHSGEVAAQALYHGQALATASGEVRAALLAAAAEERDHLGWCAIRIEELGGRQSALNPLWYAGSFAIGVAAALAGNRAGLGFVAETERQVVDHLESHLTKLPAGDSRTRAVIEQMQRDEAQHGRMATAAGGIELPSIIRVFMRASARVMTRTARWL